MYSHRWHSSDRSSRQWDDYNDRREGKIPRDSHHKNRGNGHSGAERMSRSKEYSSSPKRQSSRDSLNRDWSRKSPVRRRVTSPVWDASEKRSQRYSEDGDKDFRYKHKSVEETYRPSSDFSHNHKPSDFKYAPPQKDDFKYRRTSPDFRSRHKREEFAHRQHDDAKDTGFSDRFIEKNDHKNRWNCAPGKTRSPRRFTKIYTKTRDSPPTKVYQEDYHQNRDRVPINGSSRQSFQSDAQTAAVPGMKLSEGFQRFLNVLNKGVNVDALAKIVGQTSAEIREEYVPQSSLVNAADRSWSPGHAKGRQKLPHNSSWSGNTETPRLESPQSDLQFFSPNRQPGSDDKVLKRADGGDCLVENIILTPEDEEKHKQMQDVLQAIGVDLGSEELGQMSHRIQERLYGRKDGDRGRRLDRDRGPRQAFTSRDQSRLLSSSRSSFSPMTRDSSFIKKDLCDTQRNQTDVQEPQGRHSAEYSQVMSGSSFQNREDCKSSSQDWNVFSSTSQCSLPSSLLIPTCSPISCSPYPTRFPAPPPLSPHVGAEICLPRFPPLLSHPPVPPTMFPPELAQTGRLLPPPPSACWSSGCKDTTRHKQNKET